MRWQSLRSRCLNRVEYRASASQASSPTETQPTNVRSFRSGQFRAIAPMARARTSGHSLRSIFSSCVAPPVIGGLAVACCLTASMASRVGVPWALAFAITSPPGGGGGFGESGLTPTSLQMSASRTLTQPAMLKSRKFLHRDNLERALPDSSRQPVTRNSSRRGQPRATAIIPASCTCAQPNMSSLTKSLQYLPKASNALSPNSPTLGQPDTSTLVNPLHPEASTAKPSSVTP